MHIFTLHLKKILCLFIGHDWQTIDVIFGYGHRRGEYDILECDRCMRRGID